MYKGKKIGLVIQGPLLSIGRTGNKLHQTPEQLKKEGGVIEYDCRENINKIIKEYGSLFDEIVISTWSNEVKPDENFPGAKLVHVPDPGGIKQENHYKDNNKFRQFLSTLNGVLELENSGIDYAIKTRTDTYLDFRKLLGSFFEGIEKEENHNAIYSTAANPATFLLHDLYFAAETKTLKKFCESILAYDRFEFISSVHREMILKHAYHEFREKIEVSEWSYFPFFPPDGICKETRKVFKYMFTNVFRTLDPEIFRKTLWRGTYFEKEHVDSIVEKKVKQRKYNLPTLICIDWNRYYSFRKEETGREISFINKTRAQIGRYGWNSWNGLRALIRGQIINRN